MFGIRSRKPKSKKIVAVADIESGSAAVALVEIPGEGPARILAGERRHLPFEERTPEALIGALQTCLVEAGKHALAQHQSLGGSAPTGVYAILRAPWTHSKTLRSQRSFPEATRIHSTLIAELAREALEREATDRKRMLEASVVRVDINGYPTSEPEGKSGTELSVALLVSECDSALRSMTLHSLQHLFGSQPTTVRSGVHALFSTLREAPQVPKDFLIVDMASEGTHLIVIRDGLASNHITLPHGTATHLRRLSLNGLSEEMLTLLRLSARGSSHESVQGALERALVQSESALLRLFGEQFEALRAKSAPLPNRLVLIADQDLQSWLSRFFSRIDFAPFTATAQPFIVSPLKPAHLERWATPEGGVRADTGILIGAALVHIERGRE